jgi:VIT1/CCC1 family predicted Fe2+/Mn2+ transporter
MIESLLAFVVYVLVVGLILWLVDYVASMLPLPPPFHQVIRVVIAVIGVIILIYLLLGLIGLATPLRLRAY